MGRKIQTQFVIFIIVCLSVCQGSRNRGGGGRSDGSRGGSSGESSEEETYENCVDGQEAELSCPENHLIDLQWATYQKNGRRPCGDSNAFDKVKNLCNGQNNCQFTCDDQLFDETTCNEKKEKLKAEYECIQDPCLTYYCGNGGQCNLTDDLVPECECVGSWNGTRCDDNPCDEVTCECGSCLVNITDGTAHCCDEECTENDENPCDSLICNNGSCLMDVNGTAQCCCTDGFTGENCEIEVDACTFNPCQNGGACSVGATGMAECSCAEGFGGPACNIDCDQVKSCPAGFQEIPSGSGKCYLICSAESESWLAAQSTCLAEGATLWEPNDDTEKSDVSSVLDGLDGDQYWTGAFDGLTEGTTTFIGSGLPFTLSFTGTNTGTKDCVDFIRTTLSGPFGFEYRTCTVQTRRCICEIPDPCQS